MERVYSNHLELAADPQIDAVGVSANYAQQGETAADLLRAGKHVSMEKPMAISAAFKDIGSTASASPNPSPIPANRSKLLMLPASFHPSSFRFGLFSTIQITVLRWCLEQHPIDLRRAPIFYSNVKFQRNQVSD